METGNSGRFSPDAERQEEDRTATFRRIGVGRIVRQGEGAGRPLANQVKPCEYRKERSSRVRTGWSGMVRRPG